uniref:solute carrier organic anion transporter family member 1C1 isoform X3 n=1 Tax=Jaculus jaculus TaxID=51337 RepID=UPI001E1AF9C6|nr:solute carrier organic anion transporter family member 1C1 isoform X3 [Jaculus jaculus]
MHVSGLAKRGQISGNAREKEASWEDGKREIAQGKDHLLVFPFPSSFLSASTQTFLVCQSYSELWNLPQFPLFSLSAVVQPHFVEQDRNWLPLVCTSSLRNKLDTHCGRWMKTLPSVLFGDVCSSGPSTVKKTRVRDIFIMEHTSKENIQLFRKNSVRPAGRPSFKMEYPSSEESQPCCGELKVFLSALSFVYFSKALSEGYLKSTITQIERRFDISSSLVGVIDGSFEIGNLLVITFVSYFGAKLHRPKIIGAGCLVMGVGTLLIAMPQFFMEKYRYEKYLPSPNSTLSISPCYLDASSDLPMPVMENSPNRINDECEGAASSSMWVYVFLGNLLRGLGETPVQPLGIAYLDDFASEDNTALYIGCIQTVAIIGPIFGFLLGSLCAKLYVDIGFVNLALPRPQSKEDSSAASEKSKFITDTPVNYQTPHGEKAKLVEMARDFLPSLKNLLGNPVYVLYLCASTVQFNSLFGMVTYKPKYMEQQYGQSSAKANFVIGLINIPAVALGVLSGGIVMKKFRLGLCGASKLYLGSSVVGYLLFLSLFALGCENSDVAGLTVSYQGTKPVSYHERALFSDCNSRCKCSETKWEPMCGENGITYASACFAGCQTSKRSGKNLMFYNCTCVGISASKSGNGSGLVGRCQKDNGCPETFLYFLVLSVITSYTLSLGGIPGYILLLRCIQPQLKSFALGIYTLAVRVLAGIPAPVYFGVLIDTSCLKWGVKGCGGRGSCRLYDSNAFRYIYLGLTVILGTGSIFLSIAVLFILKKTSISKHGGFRTKRESTAVSTRFQKESCAARDHLLQPQYWPGKETRL